METFVIILAIYVLIGIIILPIFKKKSDIKELDCTHSLGALLGDIFGQLLIIIIWPLTLPTILKK